MPRTPRTQHSRRAGTPVSRRQVARDIAHTQCKALSEYTGDQEPSGPGHCARDTTHRVGTPVNRSQVAKDTADATQSTERAHR